MKSLILTTFISAMVLSPALKAEENASLQHNIDHLIQQNILIVEKNVDLQIHQDIQLSLATFSKPLVDMSNQKMNLVAKAKPTINADHESEE